MGLPGERERRPSSGQLARSGLGEDQLTPRLSVVVPAYNEETLLPRLAESIIEARRAVGDDAVEVIVADNASTDGTAAVARKFGFHVAPVERRAISAARNGGAAAARAPILTFIDADSSVHPRIFEAILTAMDDPRVGMGASGMRFDRNTPGIATVVALFTPMAKMMGIDGGAVFMRRDDFEAAGRYDESILVAEDIDLLMRVRKRCRARGQEFRRLQGVETVVSARKFESHGDWHFVGAAIGMAWDRMFRPERFRETVKRYWYEDR